MGEKEKEKKKIILIFVNIAFLNMKELLQNACNASDLR